MRAVALLLCLATSATASDITPHEENVRRLAAQLAEADAKSRTNVAFKLARAYEEWAAADPAHRDQHLDNALETYSRIWSTPGRSDAVAAARNNCAQIFVVLGNDQRAAGLFRSAASIKGELQPFYLANYAAFLAARGNKAEAIANYERALRLKTDDVASETKLLQLYDGAAVANHLWQLVERNALERAQSIALEHLGREHTSTVKRDLLAIVLVTLAEQRVGASAFAESATKTALAAIKDPSVRQGINELQRLYGGDLLVASAYGWWKQQGALSRPPAIDAPVAFSKLARELGEQAREASKKTAERYFLLGMEVSEGRDPEPIISLTELYYADNRAGDLQRFIHRYNDRVFSEKGAAYRNGDWGSIYRFHVALGTVFARLGWAGNEHHPQSAIFQFEHARLAAQRLSKPRAEVVLDPRSVELLAQSYKKAQPQGTKDVRVRIEAAEQYVKAGKIASAARVLTPAAGDVRLQGKTKLRYDKLVRQVPQIDAKTIKVQERSQ